ncbi:hypothetical protein [Williamsia deligens]|uniref:Uncharacterized protein n=1 Tax=Williamsia deligens TaxID=321325 RepID=A0ABW3G5L1_9NOCA|nr:hypothetical protein [Williamsia deligens]MCP2193238.1 hypothetical protein [Williamsia deligens]
MTATLASHSLLLALPAFVPAVLLVGVIVAIAVRDRRRGDDEGDELPLEDWGTGDGGTRDAGDDDRR